jgi:PhnB protein
MAIQPYLHFEGRCEEAIEFYKSKLGAEVEMMARFKDAPDPPAVGPWSLQWCHLGGKRDVPSVYRHLSWRAREQFRLERCSWSCLT